MKIPFRNRTIQMIGGHSQGITLPREILEALGLCMGSDVDLLLITGKPTVNDGKPAVILVPAENPPKPKK